MIDNWLEENLDFFWDDPNLKKQFTMKGGKDIENLMSQKSDILQKRRFLEKLQEHAEQLVIERRNQLRQRRIENLKDGTRYNLTLRQKTDFIENHIESDIRYYTTNKANVLSKEKKTDYGQMIRTQQKIQKAMD